MGKGLRRNGAPGLQGRHLGVQLLDAGDPGAGDGLIGADDHTTNGTDPVQSGDGRDGDDGGTIGVGDDAAVVGCGDQIRKGAATNAVQIAELLFLGK